MRLTGASLRIEYCLDTDGFWLEPHTDIGAKLFTMLIYLSNEPGCDAWGTDLYHTAQRWVATTPYRRNCGFIFIPGPDTSHGVECWPIRGVRRSLIVNYVAPEWRSRHELAFPDRAWAIGAKISFDPTRLGLILETDAKRRICPDGPVLRLVETASGRP